MNKQDLESFIQTNHRNLSTLLFGHADADGHIAAEQSRRNLIAMGVSVAQVVVSPQLTRNHRFWLTNFGTYDFRSFGMVVAVDIAFDFREPYRSLAEVVGAAATHPNTQFVVIDHHPLWQRTACCYGLGVP